MQYSSIRPTGKVPDTQGLRKPAYADLRIAGDEVAPSEKAGEASFLGIYTKFASRPESKRRRALRFYLQSVARELLPDERVSWCLRRLRPHESHVYVMHSEVTGRAGYDNLIVCGRLWVCPVCAARISEQRRLELSEAIAGSPYHPFMATLTLQHDEADGLAELVAVAKDCYRRLKSGRWWQGFIAEAGIVGSIHALEVTHGANGWHPHIHVLFFSERPFDETEAGMLELLLAARWRELLRKHGRYASWAHGVEVTPSDRAEVTYIQKLDDDDDLELVEQRDGWQVEHELVKAISKRGRGKGRTYLQLLADYANGDELAGRLVQEYAIAMKARKHLVWSRGLRELLGAGREKPDAEIAEQLDEAAVILARLNYFQWQKVADRGLRSDLLDVADSGDAGELLAWLAARGIEADSGGLPAAAGSPPEAPEAPQSDFTAHNAPYVQISGKTAPTGLQGAPDG